MRKAFNFYASYYAVFEDLTDAQIGQLMRELTQVQFLDKHIDEVKFKDKIVSIVWKSIKHSVLEQIKGYCSKRSIAYESVLPDPMLGVGETSPDPTLQGEEKEKEKGKGKEEGEYTHNDLTLEQIEKIVKYRKSIKAPLKTQRGFNGLAKNILFVMEKKQMLFDEVLELMAVREWKSIQLDWISKSQNYNSQIKSPPVGSIAWQYEQEEKQKQEIIDV